MNWRIEKARTIGAKSAFRAVLTVTEDELEHLAKCVEDNDQFNAGESLQPDMGVELRAAALGLTTTAGAKGRR